MEQRQYFSFLSIMNTCCGLETKKTLQNKDSQQNFRTHSCTELCRSGLDRGMRPLFINKYINKVLRTQCSTCLFSTPVHNLQLLVRSRHHHRVAPAIWNRPYIFQDLLSASLNLHLLSNHGDPNAHPGPQRKVPGICPQTMVLPLRNAIAFKQP